LFYFSQVWLLHFCVWFPGFYGFSCFLSAVIAVEVEQGKQAEQRPHSIINMADEPTIETLHSRSKEKEKDSVVQLLQTQQQASKDSAAVKKAHQTHKHKVKTDPPAPASGGGLSFH
jgi:hypothetical protein